MHKIVLIGYSGHAYVVCDIFETCDLSIIGYCDTVEKISNPYKLSYLGREEELKVSNDILAFVAIGDNIIRKKIASNISWKLAKAIHPSAIVASTAMLSSGIMIGANATVNSLASIGKGVIVNTGAIVEHECEIQEFSHIAPSVVLTGNVSIGSCSFIGANSVVNPGVKIGNNVIVGSGSVIVRDIPDGVTVVGNPGRILRKDI